jgi:hypothetical protein
MTLIQFLLLAVPTLETLVFSASCMATSTMLIAAAFTIVDPRLMELTIAGYYPFPHLPTSFPRLERLHLRGNRNSHGLLHMSLDAIDV